MPPEQSLRDELDAAFDSATDTPSPAVETPAPTDVAAPQGAAAPAAAPAVSGEPALEPHAHWPDTHKAAFKTAPRDLQKIWLDRETEYQRGTSKAGQERAHLLKDRETWDGVFREMDRDLELSGVSRHQFVQRLVGWNKYFVQDPAGAIRELARQTGVDLAALAQQPGAASTDPALAQLTERLAGVETQLTERQKLEQQERKRAAYEQVVAFADAKGPDGQPLHPYFDEVHEDVLRIMRADGRLGLETAYKKALRMNDAVFAKVQASERQANAAKEEQERKARIDQAKRASVGTGSDGAGSAAAKPATLRDELEQRFAAYG